MKKKAISFLLATFLVATSFLTGCGESQTTDQSGEAAVETEASEPTDQHKIGGQLTLGNGTELSGDWVSNWTNNAADLDILYFISGYSTAETNFNGEYVVNETAVEKYDVKTNDDGSKTYTWTIKDGLQYSDGTPITAKDYVASVMLFSSKTISDLGGKAFAGVDYVGYEDFNSGKTKEFKGVRLLDDKTFSITLDPSILPYYYELANASAGPDKLSFWTDENVTIQDDGNGCYFSDNFTAENYKDKIMAARYATDTWPATGGYKIKSFDKGTKVAVLEINDKYLGNHEGQKPSIQTIIYKKVNDETAMDELETKQVDMLMTVGDGVQINRGLDIVEKGGFASTDYPRSGYGQLIFSCDFGPTASKNVRQAIAHLLDRNDFAKAFTGGYGSVVNGPYGEPLWFYQETKAELNKKLNQYPYSLDTAVKLLEEDGWVLDEKGNPYKEGIRYKKMEDGKLMPLIINWASSENSPVAELLVIKLQENPDVAKAGMKINQTTMIFPELLNYYYRDDSTDPKYAVPTYHLFNMGSGFPAIYDHKLYFIADPKAQSYNYSRLYNKDLEAASKLALTDGNDREGFKKKFVDYVVLWNDLLPELPLYSNQYFDFYSAKLKNYERTDLIKVAQALEYAHIEE